MVNVKKKIQTMLFNLKKSDNSKNSAKNFFDLKLKNSQYLSRQGLTTHSSHRLFISFMFEQGF